LLASLDAVRIRITARADSVADADRLIEAMDAQVRSRLPNLVVGVDDETIETVVAGLLATRGWTIAVADAQTGGAVIQRLAAAGGRSIVGGLTLPVCGEPDRDADAAATALAEQARSQFGATCGLGVTPCGEGTACVAFLSPDGVTTWRFGFPGSEESSRIRISVLAFEALRRRLLGIEVSEP